jgi:hypothetical protein
MSDDYVQAFKQFSLYYAFLQGGASRTDLDNNELCLRRANQFGDPVRIAVAVAKYTSSFNHMLEYCNWKARNCLDQLSARQTFHLGQK